MAKKRPRFASVGAGVRVYDTQSAEKKRFREAVADQVPEMISGPIFVAMRFFMPRPKNHYRTGRNAGVIKLSAPNYHTTKPDIDNMEKFVADCLNGIAWTDDSQIVMSHTSKHYADDGNPRTEIEVLRADEFV